MNIREMARKLGGEKLVDKVNWEQKAETEMNERLHQFQDEMIERFGTDKERELLTCVALAEAFSKAYAVAACLVHELQGSDNTGELLTIAIRSLVHNMEKVGETIDAQKGGIGNMIRTAAKRGKKGE
jgi:hypothetical protein